MRSEKQLLLDDIKEQIDRHDSFVIMQYSGLDANRTSDFRRQIAEYGGSVEIVKKRVLVKAANELGIELDLKKLPGHIGIVFTGEDSILATKAVFDLRKETKDKINVLGGQFEGRMLGSEEVETLSKLPGKDEMRAQLLGVFIAPMQQTVGAMNALLCSVLYCLENKIKKEEGSN
jgi:large subunit ribosomal protein L10